MKISEMDTERLRVALVAVRRQRDDSRIGFRALSELTDKMVPTIDKLRVENEMLRQKLEKYQTNGLQTQRPQE